MSTLISSALRQRIALLGAMCSALLATPVHATPHDQSRANLPSITPYAMSPNAISPSEITPSFGVYFSVPLGGRDRRPWQDKAEFGFAMRANMAGTDITGRAMPVLHRDLAAIRFNRHGFDRMSLSGRDYYLTDEGISLYAEGDPRTKDGGSNNWLIYVGIGVVALVGVSAWAGKKVVDNICDDNC